MTYRNVSQEQHIRDKIAPINYYDRLWWLAAIVILAFIFLTLGVNIFLAEYFAILFLFIMGGMFAMVFWIQVKDPLRPPIQMYVIQVAVGFTMGLGGLWFLFYIVPQLTMPLWSIPELPPQVLSVFGNSGAILIQVGVGTIEEGVFRVGLPRLLLERGVSPVAGIFMTSWTFGLFHWMAYGANITSVMFAVFVAFLQSFAYFSSKSVLGVMIGHIVWNITAAGLLSQTYQLLLLGLLVIGVGFLGYRKAKQKKWGLPF